MYIEHVILLPGFEEKLIIKHHVYRNEVKHVLLNQPFVKFIEKWRSPGEDVYTAHGQTESGRYLIVFFVFKRNRHALVISARDMDDKERKQYGMTIK